MIGNVVIEVATKTRRCIVKYSEIKDHTEDELHKMYDELPPSSGYKSDRGTGFEGFSKNNRKYRAKFEEECTFHIFSQETEENSDGNIQYPVAIVELEDGTVKIVGADSIRFIKEEENNG